jgi:hypothetical protein
MLLCSGPGRVSGGGDPLERIYNHEKNGVRLKEWSVPELDYYPGSNQQFQLREHQKRVVGRLLAEPTLLAHAVGTGKTFIMSTAAMEMRRLGLAKKPMIVVQNATVGGFASQFQNLYPGARILVPSTKQRQKKHRRRLVQLIRTGDWDAVIVPQSWFNMLDDDPERVAAFTRNEIAQYEVAIKEAKEEQGGKSVTVKNLEKALQNLKDRLKKLQDRKKDEGVTFESLGIDALFVDEAHAYKKLEFSTQMENVKGLDRGASQRGLGLFMKSQYVLERTGGRNVVLATGTPVSNTIAEAWNMLRFIRPDLLEQYGVERFDDFASAFGDTVTQIEQTAGGNFKSVTRFARYTNGPELIALFHSAADVVTNDMVKIPGLPRIRGGGPATVKVPMTPGVDAARARIQAELEAFDQMTGQEKRENSHIPLVMFGIGKKATLDLRLLPLEWQRDIQRQTGIEDLDEPGNKLNTAVGRMLEIYHERADISGAQLVFADLFQNRETGFNLYEEIKRKLVEQGVPAEEIAMINQAKSDAQREGLFDRVRAGEVRFLLGSTEKMGVGVNVQNLLVANHHLDVPHRPMDMEQRDGRIFRQGNQAGIDDSFIDIVRYGVEKSMDAALYQRLAVKQMFINQILKGDITGRNFDDAADEVVLTYQEQMAAYTGNPLALEKVGLDQKVRELRMLKQAHGNEVASAVRRANTLEERIPRRKEFAEQVRQDAAELAKLVETDVSVSYEEGVAATGNARVVEETDPKKAVKLLDRLISKAREVRAESGQYGSPVYIPGLKVWGMAVGNEVRTKIRGEWDADNTHLHVEFKSGAGGLIEGNVTTGQGLVQTIKRGVKKLEGMADNADDDAQRYAKDVIELRDFAEQPWSQEEELVAAETRLAEVDEQLEKGQEVEEDKPIDQAAQEAAGRVSLENDEKLTGIIPNMFQPGGGRDDRLWSPGENPERGPQSHDPEVEKRLQASKGLRVTLWERLGEALEGLAQSFTRHFRHLDPGKDGEVIEILYQVERIPEKARVSAAQVLRGFVAGFGDRQYELFWKYIVVADLSESIEEGLYVGKELPFGYSSAAAVAEDLNEFQRWVDANPKVRDAVVARKKFFGQLARKLVKLDLIPRDALYRENYFHRMTLEYMERGSPMPGGIGQDVRKKRKGFQMERKGSEKDYNTELIQAEYEVITDALTQIFTLEQLVKLDKASNQFKTLKQAAKIQNRNRFYEVLEEEEGTGAVLEDPLAVYRRKIAWANAQLGKLADEGELDVSEQYDDLVEALATSYRERKAFLAENPDKESLKDAPSVGVSDARWFNFLSELFEARAEGAEFAGTIFRAIREREDQIRTYIGDDYVTWRDLVPEDHIVWQPERGNFFFWTNSINDHDLAQMIEEGDLNEEKVRRVIAVGGRRPEWVIPRRLADTLDNFRDYVPDRFWGERFVMDVMGKWKQWILLNPWSVFRYNLNNSSGDLDIALAYEPAILKRVAGAAAKLHKFHVRRGAPSRELLDYIGKGIINSGFAGTEVPSMSGHDYFDAVMGRNPNLIKKWWGLTKDWTVWRENVLRVASYEYFLEEMKKGRRLYGASRPEAVDAILRIEDRAAKVSRELIGDYGAISVAGQWIRSRIVPFYSWWEINAPRYYRLFANLSREDEGAVELTEDQEGVLTATKTDRQRAMGWALALKVGRRASLAFLFMGAVVMWNRLRFPDEDERINGKGQPLKLILGKREDGQVIALRMQGALSDALGWFGFDNPIADVDRLQSGEMSLADKGQEMYEAPVNRIVNGSLPITKTVFESMLGRSFYPNAFAPRPVRDPLEHLASGVGLRHVYRVVAQKPARQGWQSLLGVVTYSMDPGETAYITAKELVYDFLEESGEDGATLRYSRRSNALYYHKMAVRFNDAPKAEKYLMEYFENGGTYRGLASSVNREHPLGPIPNRRLKKDFMDRLSPAEHEVMRGAEDWWRETYGRSEVNGEDYYHWAKEIYQRYRDAKE